MYNRYKKTGWFGESHRHYLAAKGVKTKKDKFFFVKQEELKKGKWYVVRLDSKSRPRREEFDSKIEAESYCDQLREKNDEIAWVESGRDYFARKEPESKPGRAHIEDVGLFSYNVIDDTTGRVIGTFTKQSDAEFARDLKIKHGDYLASKEMANPETKPILRELAKSGADELRAPEVQKKVYDIEKRTVENKDYRRVLDTEKHTQVVLMSIPPKGDIGPEIHPDVDQFFRIEKGNGKLLLDGKPQKIQKNSAWTVPAGTEHDVVNTGKSDLKLYTVYGPPNHAPGIVRKTKKQAEDIPE